MKMIRIACNVPIASDPTSWYRGVGPLAALQKIMPLQFTFFDVNQDPMALWPTLKLNDLVFLQRPCGPAHLNALIIAKDLGIPVWADIDDDNLSVPKDNPQYYQYNQMPVKEAIVKLARGSDIITTTTERLCKKYSIYNDNITIIPNALDWDVLSRHRNIQQRPREKTILWRGTATHKRNLDMLKNELKELAAKHKDWKFGFMGFDPIDITDGISNHFICGANGAIETYKMIPQIHAYAGYYVLANNDHAQSRSHIAWLEYTFAGMPTVAIQNEEFTRPGIMNFKTGQEFMQIMEDLIAGRVDTEAKVKESWDCIQENYLLSKVNLQRKQVIEKLLNIQSQTS